MLFLKTLSVTVISKVLYFPFSQKFYFITLLKLKKKSIPGSHLSWYICNSPLRLHVHISACSRICFHIHCRKHDGDEQRNMLRKMTFHLTCLVHAQSACSQCLLKDILCLPLTQKMWSHESACTTLAVQVPAGLVEAGVLINEDLGFNLNIRFRMKRK